MDDREHARIRGVQAGDTAAFGALYDAYIDRIYRFVWYKTHHRETAEDLTSAVFMKAFERIGTFDSSKGNFSGWLYGIARNAVIDHYRKRRDVQDIEDAWDLASDSDVVRDVEARTMIERLKKGLGGLTPDQRDVVIMRLWEQMSYAEIAEALGKSEPACRMTFARASATLRDIIPLLILLMIFTDL